MTGLLWVAALVALAGAAPPAPPSVPALRIISETVLPPGLEKAVDVRWASDRAVYLPLMKDGTVEASVDPAGPPPREMIPGANAPGGWSFNVKVGASSSYLVVAGPLFGLTWRELDKPLRQEAVFEFIDDLDVAGKQLLVLGARRDAKNDFAPDGTIAWIGSLDKGLADLRPVLADSRGAGAPNMVACALFEMGGVRFLADGSFVVVPGVQPGAYLYDAKGKLLRTWDTGAVGLDSDCASVSEAEHRRMAVDFDARVAWLNRRRTLDEILPLPQGAGLVVRSVVDGRPHWQLKLLRPSGGVVATYDIPIAPDSPRSHLRGDVRGGRIVFVLCTYEQDIKTKRRPASRLILAEAPGR
ncbi:MAG TPA: hypothetical protein VHR45_03815 [Thermoanaerobaculia bacterium]|nr:hypothetical protein [Thermoanaerobaculia bacterium]